MERSADRPPDLRRRRRRRRRSRALRPGDRAGAGVVGDGLGRPPAVGRGQLADHPEDDRRQALRGRGQGARRRSHRRLARLSLGAAAGRGLPRRRPRHRHVGQHPDRPPAVAGAADQPADPRRGPPALRGGGAEGLADHQARGPQGQDRRRPRRRRSLQRLLADAPARARQRRPQGLRHHRRQHPDPGPGRLGAGRHGRGDRHLSGLPQGPGRDRGEGDHELLRPDRGRLQRPRRRRRGTHAPGGEELGLLSRRLLPAPLLLDLHRRDRRRARRRSARPSSSPRSAPSRR